MSQFCCKNTKFFWNQQENDRFFYTRIMRTGTLILWSVIENYGSGVPVRLALQTSDAHIGEPGMFLRQDACRREWTVVRSQWHPQCVPTCESVTRHLDDGNVLRGDGGWCMGGLWRGLSSWLFFSFLLFFLFPSFFSRVPYYILINKRARWT